MRVFLNKSLHNKEEEILYHIATIGVFKDIGEDDLMEVIENRLFDIEKYTIRTHGWYTSRKRWVGPGDFLPWFIPQFWFKNAAYLHDGMYNWIESGTAPDWLTKEVADDIFLAVSKAYKPPFIKWNSVVARFYRYMLEQCGDNFLDD